MESVLSRGMVGGGSLSKHTPGPWKWVKNKWRGGYSGIEGPNNEEVLFPNHCNDGDEGDAWFEDSPSEADRNMIKAAPDMYEALKELMDALEKLAGGLPDSTITGPYFKMRDAIASVEGRTAE